MCRLLRQHSLQRLADHLVVSAEQQDRFYEKQEAIDHRNHKCSVRDPICLRGLHETDRLRAIKVADKSVAGAHTIRGRCGVARSRY